MFFLQMSGFPGSGKSTLARLIAKETSAVIVDHDIVKSALLESMNDSIEAKVAGKISYNIDWSLIDFHLSQGHNVIFDSPCLYSEMVQKGLDLTEKYGAEYKYVECLVDDFHLINERLKTRNRKISQIKEIASEETFYHAVASSKKPSNKECLVINSGQPIENYLDEVLKYVCK
ncbi:AAA family ATPase [Falsibacillus pallidus]|uniref:Putative kinase n=1 Tax=Falsibacillus pallidus TaxID=493781 RepID=A0A370GAT2_9BACI|nr:ATP-binding protein [Falsibacillus pallidus]RDI39103.1 putative kinase [Falsibacillus pallidus]